MTGKKDPYAFRHISSEEKDTYIKQNSDFGKIVCLCKWISDGEILAAIRTNPSALDMGGIKRRSRSGI